MMQVTKAEAKELTTAELRAKLSALMRQMGQAHGCEYETRASLEVVSGELLTRGNGGGNSGSGSAMKDYL